MGKNYASQYGALNGAWPRGQCAGERQQRSPSCVEMLCLNTYIFNLRSSGVDMSLPGELTAYSVAGFGRLKRTIGQLFEPGR